MSGEYSEQLKRIIGPYGEPMTVHDLPPADTKRWVIRRKAMVVAAVRGGLISLEEACRKYTLSVEEFFPGRRLSTSTAFPDCARPASSFTATATRCGSVASIAAAPRGPDRYMVPDSAAPQTTGFLKRSPSLGVAIFFWSGPIPFCRPARQ